MDYQPEIIASMAVSISFPTLHLEVDGDEESDYTGVFEGRGHDITFYGPSPDHVIGAAHRYAEKLTGGGPYKLEVEIPSDEVREGLADLP